MASLMQNLGLEVGSVVVCYDYETRKEVRGVVAEMPQDSHQCVYIRWDSGDDCYCKLNNIFAVKGRTEYATY